MFLLVWGVAEFHPFEVEQDIGVFFNSSGFNTIQRHLAHSLWFSSVQFSHSVVSNSLQPHELQHTRLPCPSPAPGAYSDSRPSSWWCHPTISSSVVPFSSCLQSFPGSGSFQMSQFFASGRKSTGLSASSPSIEHSGLIAFRIDWLDLLAVQGTLKSLLQCHNSKTSILQHLAFFIVQLSHPYIQLENHSFD